MTDKFNPSSVYCQELFRGEENLYKIPDFQRPYSWEKKHIQQLWDDLHQAWQDYENGEIESYYLGPIILINEERGSRLSILDGQQRLTSLTIFYSILYHEFREKLNGKNARRVSKRLKSDTLDKYRLQTG
ncbi:MAG: DUF262 domain-containing protein, partial [Candidatus Nanohaloarchaea archaeon]